MIIAIGEVLRSKQFEQFNGNFAEKNLTAVNQRHISATAVANTFVLALDCTSEPASV